MSCDLSDRLSEEPNLAHHILLVQSNPVEGREDEYNDWYTNQHLPDLLRVPGFVAAQRFKLSPVQRQPNAPPHEFRYIAIYEIEGDPTAAMTALTAAIDDGMRLGTSMDRSTRISHVFMAITERQVQNTEGLPAHSGGE